MIGVLNLETSNKEKLSAKVMENYMEIKESAQITDNRREITELTEAEQKELESLANQYGRNSFEYHKCLMHFKHIGEEIPEDVPAIEYYDYILKNFRNGQQLSKQTIPLIDRQKRIIERVRNGTDFDVFSSQKFLEMLS